MVGLFGAPVTAAVAGKSVHAHDRRGCGYHREIRRRAASQRQSRGRSRRRRAAVAILSVHRGAKSEAGELLPGDICGPGDKGGERIWDEDTAHTKKSEEGRRGKEG